MHWIKLFLSHKQEVYNRTVKKLFTFFNINKCFTKYISYLFIVAMFSYKYINLNFIRFKFSIDIIYLFTIKIFAKSL